MRITVLIVSYQRPALLANCLRALEGQDRLPDEVIVVGVEGDRPTAEAVEAFRTGATIPCVWLRAPEPSVVIQTNLGLEACQGGIVAFTNDDAEPHPDWLARMEPYFDDDTVGGVGGRDYVYRDGVLWQGEAECVGQITWYGRHHGNHHLDYHQVTEVDVLKGVNMGCRRELLEVLDSRMASGGQWHWELDACGQVRRNGKRLVYDPQIRVDHFHGPRTAKLLPGFVYAANYNLTLCLGKHLHFPWLWVFVAYNFLWGDYPEMGLAVFGRTYLERLVRHRDWRFIGVLATSMRGKVHALGALQRGQ